MTDDTLKARAERAAQFHRGQDSGDAIVDAEYSFIAGYQQGYLARAKEKEAEALLRTAVVQVNRGDGYYSHHRVILQKDHPGHSGIVIHAGEQIDGGDNGK